MRSETVQLFVPLDEAAAMTVARVLNAVNGVSKVAITTASASVNIDFDEDMTSVQELRSCLDQAGFRTKKSAHGSEGVCCGSCGG